MKKLLVSAAIAAFLAAPAMAQDRGDDHRGGGDRGGAQHQQAPQQAPAQQPAPQQPAAAAQPNQQHGQTPNFAGRPNNNNARRDDHRFDNNANNNRPAFNNNNRPAFNNNRPAFNNNNRPAFNNNARPGFNNNHNWASYHRNFNATRRFHAPAYRRPPGWYAHRWVYGDRLPAAFWTAQYWLNDFFDYGLMDPPPGTVWVRDGDDALLIDRYTGEVIQVEYGVFY